MALRLWKKRHKKIKNNCWSLLTSRKLQHITKSPTTENDNAKTDQPLPQPANDDQPRKAEGLHGKTPNGSLLSIRWRCELPSPKRFLNRGALAPHPPTTEKTHGRILSQCSRTRRLPHLASRHLTQPRRLRCAVGKLPNQSAWLVIKQAHWDQPPSNQKRQPWILHFLTEQTHVHPHWRITTTS